jgi:hypothetical protein
MRSPWARPVPCRERAGKQARDAAHRADLWCSAARAVPPRALHPQDRSPEQQPGAPGWAQRDRSLRSNIRWWQATMAPPPSATLPRFRAARLLDHLKNQILNVYVSS